MPRRSRPPGRPDQPLSRRTVVAIDVAIVGALVGAWQLFGSTSDYARLVFSTPSDVLGTLGGWAGEASRWHDVLVTLEEGLLGFAVGTGLAFVLAILVVMVPWTARVLEAPVSALNAIPRVALAPLFIVWLGIGTTSKLVYAASAIFFIAFYSLMTGLRAIDPAYVDRARSLGASRSWTLRAVYVPSGVGWIMTSLRLSITWALIAAVTAEYLGSSQGLGNLILQGQYNLKTKVVLAGVLLIALIGFTGDRLLVRLERRFTTWRLS
jgi:NitT/TauT family transport system permease protein